MASFIAKQVVGKKLDSVKDAFADKDDKKSDAEHDEAAIAEARQEAEERRKDKHRKMEEDREKMRQDIRDKYGIKKRESDANVSLSRDEVRKKFSTAGMSGDLQTNQAAPYPRNVPVDKSDSDKCLIQ